MGGMDDLYSVAPKEPSEVKKGVFPVFGSTELTGRGSLRLAPGWACLAPYQARMQVITGIQCSTVSHHTGVHQTYQMRRNLASDHEPRFITNAGEALAPNALLHSIHVHAAPNILGVGPQSAGRGFVDDSGGQILAQLHRVASDETLYGTARHALAAAIESSCAGSSCESFRMTDSLLEKLHGTAAPAVPPPGTRIGRAEWPSFADDALTQADGMEFSWVLYALAHDLAPAVFMVPMALWDTHINNEIMQRPMNRQFALRLKYLLDGLAAIERGGRPVLDDVGIVILSELGRFPYVNAVQGKDHFPQISATLIGPGLQAGRFGETDAELLGSEVSFRTGHPGRGGSLLTLDDLGRTLLEWVGHPDPEGVGYDGRVMEFCFA
jgi:uncharacterized protein (DUF1501 family)